MASPVFKDMVESGLPMQSRQIQCPRLIEVPLQGDDPDALLILLYLIHCRFKEVPRKVALETLTWIAFLVDKYELLEVTEFLRDHWLSGIKENVPTELSDDLLSWMFITEVFQEKGIFSKVSNVAKIESKGLLSMRDLPIPGEVFGMDLTILGLLMTNILAAKINSCRQAILREIFTYLEEIREGLLCKRICPNSIECDGMALGCLMIGLKELNILQPPEPPYENVSIKDVFEGLRAMRVPQYCRVKKKKSISNSEGKICEGVERPLLVKIDELEHQLKAGISG